MSLKNKISAFAVAATLSSALLFTPPAQARPVNFDQATITELQAAMAAGTLTAERLVELCLARIAAYDRAGPKLHAVMAVNPKALEIARQLDAERKAGKVRGPMHGIPVLFKDNIDTVDMATTGGSVFLEGNMPPDDAHLVKQLRDAGAIIFAKVNLGEFANGFQSSLGGQSRNPHDLSRTPSGSSGGTGVAIAAGYAPLGYGTDTGGSIRGPSSVNGLAGMRPTYGLISHDGVIPLSLTLDMAGPMARSVTDVAISLGITAGIDPADATTKTQQGRAQKDYTKFLNADGLKGARIGLARDFVGFDPDVEWIVEASIKAMERAGATIVEVRLPKWFVDSASIMLWSIYPPEFAVQIGDYLKTTGPKYPKSLDEMIERGYQYTSLGLDGAGTNPYRWSFFLQEKASGPMTDPGYLAARDYGMPMAKALIDGTLQKDKLDAIVYPTGLRRPPTIVGSPATSGGGGVSASVIAPLTGFPDLIVPAGFTTDDLPVTISFLGTAYSEPKLLAMGYAFEQATRAIRRPVHTPALPGEQIEVPEK